MSDPGRLGGSASALLSVAAGVIAAVAVALAWVPLSQDTLARETEALQRQLGVTARLVAALVTVVEEAPAAVLESAARDSDASSIVLADAGGGVLAAFPPGAVAPDVPDAACPGRDAAVHTGSVDHGGDVLQVACARLDDGRRVVVSAPTDVQDALLRARLRAGAMLLGLGLSVGLVVAGGTRWLLSPVEAVSRAAGSIAAGGRGVRVEPRGPEEIRKLARAVNALAGAFETREDEIRGRLEVVTQLSSMVAHEVRNPLQSLSLLCALARTEEDAARRTALLQKIEDEIHVLEGVVQRFLRNSGPLQISRSPTDLVDLVERAAAVAEPEARSKSVRLMVQVPGKLPANVDGSLVRRAIENLMLNAIEFASHDAPGQVTVAVLPGTRTAQLVVEDDGPGVPKGDRERIFQAYYSSKAGGTGLGLALVKQVIVAHGGSIQCTASALGGARFEASLPLDDPERTA